MPEAITYQALTERVDASRASVRELFGEDGTAVRDRLNRDPNRQRRVTEAVRLYQRALTGDHWDRAALREAISTGDFPALFGDALDRQLYRAYEATQPSWRSYARVATVPDFREVKRFATTGFRGRLSKVAERENYRERSQEEVEYRYAVEKYGALIDISWETFVNDDLGAFARAPGDLAQSVIDEQEAFVAERINSGFSDPGGEVGGSGAFFHADNDNLLTDALERDSLNEATTKLMTRKDDNGNPIVVRAVHLVVGPALTMTANEILNTVQFRQSMPDGSVRIIAGNGVHLTLNTHTNFWLPAAMPSDPEAWFLFADPGSSRPALEVGLLRGHESPALYERRPNQTPDDGFGFEDDSMARKVRTVHGGALVDPKMAIAGKPNG